MTRPPLRCFIFAAKLTVVIQQNPFTLAPSTFRARSCSYACIITRSCDTFSLGTPTHGDATTLESQSLAAKVFGCGWGSVGYAVHARARPVRGLRRDRESVVPLVDAVPGAVWCKLVLLQQ